MFSLTLKLAPKYLCSNKLGLAFDQRPQRLKDTREEEEEEGCWKYREADGEVFTMLHSPWFREDRMQNDLGGSAGGHLWSNICRTKQKHPDLSWGSQHLHHYPAVFVQIVLISSRCRFWWWNHLIQVISSELENKQGDGSFWPEFGKDIVIQTIRFKTIISINLE